jgi:hypothetical protein
MDWAKLESWVRGAGCCVWVKLGVVGLVSVWVSVFVDEDAIGKKELQQGCLIEGFNEGKKKIAARDDVGHSLSL